MKDFEITKKVHYLDNAATTQKPTIVIKSLSDFYLKYNANTHRGIYRLSENATIMLNDARKAFASFINASADEIIFTKNATEGFNNIAISLQRTFRDMLKTGNIVITEIEHHSNLVPWQELSKRSGAELRIARYQKEINNLEDISKLVDNKTIAVSFTGMSNVTGIILGVNTIVKNIRKINPKTIIIVDATQLIAHKKVDVKDLDIDVLCFSAHKIYGTTGVGIIYAKKSLLEKLEPFNYGGNMISNVELNNSSWAEIPDKFEAGTIDAAGIIASSKALMYLKDKGLEKIFKKEEELKDYAVKKLRTIQGLKIIGHDNNKNKDNTNNDDYGPVISFTIDGFHPHDIATICDQFNVCIRAGHHCAQPFMKALGVNATSRISLSFYNNKKDIDVLINALNHAIKVLK